MAEHIIVSNYTCNNNCVFCSVGDKAHSIDVNKILDKIRAIPNEDSVEFIGGEITISAYFFKMLRASNRLRKVSIETNGRMFSISGFAEKAKSAGLDAATVSIHGIGEIHDQLTRSKGAYKQAVIGLRNLIKAGINVRINHVLTKLSLPHLPRFVKEHNYVDLIIISSVNPVGNAKNNYDIVPEMKDIKQYAELPGIIFHNFPSCIIPYNKQIPSKFKHGRVIEIDEKKSLLDEIDHLKCKPCNCELTCDGIWKGYVDMYSWKIQNK